MKSATFTFLCAMAVGVAACADTSGPVAPKTLAWEGNAAWGVQTAVVYSNFGPGMAFDANNSWTINGFLGGGTGQQAISQQFTPSGYYIFTSASVALSHFTGPVLIRLFLQADSSGKPGPVIEQLSLVSIGSPPAVYQVNSVLFPTLDESVPYWLTVTAGANGVVAGWNWNSTGDISSATFASTQGGGPGGPWGVASGVIRSAFEIVGRERPPSALAHQASGGGTVRWSSGELVTYGINARQFRDGSVKGEILFHRHSDHLQFKGTVTCLAVVGNRAYLTGDLTQASPPYNYPHFAIGLEDNGEGRKATAPDRISGLLPLPLGWPSCYTSIPITDWTNGNAQVR